MFEVELVHLRDKKPMWVQTENIAGITSRIPMGIWSLSGEYRKGGEVGNSEHECIDWKAWNEWKGKEIKMVSSPLLFFLRLRQGGQPLEAQRSHSVNCRDEETGGKSVLEILKVRGTKTQ